MGRDTSITIENKKEYNKMTKVDEVLEFDDIDGETFHWLELYSEKLKWKSHVKEIAYWGKSDCNEIVEIMREYDYEDGDIILTQDMVGRIEHLLNNEQFNEIQLAFENDELLVVYNTNG